MASGLAIVATDVGGNREVLAGGTMGSLVPAEASGLLADAIIAALSSPAALRRAGVAARREVETRFSSAETARSYAARYRAAQAAMIDPGTRSAA
jgi:glycosyltransferase involved in cell wall biosynthesis